MSENSPKFEAQKRNAHVMDSFDVQNRITLVTLAKNPLGYLTRKIDALAMAHDEPGDIEIARELLGEITDDLIVLFTEDTIDIDPALALIKECGIHSEYGIKAIFTIFKEAGFEEETMLAAIAIETAETDTQFNNRSNEKYLREVYR